MQKTTSKPVFPTATVSEYRLRLFQATRRPKLINQLIVTPWGKVRVQGRLGQAHADVFEAICYEREVKAELEDGRIKLLVDPFKVRKRAGCASGSAFQKIKVELQTAYIEIFEPIEKACEGHLVDHIEKACRKDGSIITRKNPLTSSERHLWRVELGKAFCKLIECDIWVGYDPSILTAFEHGISQAIVRHVLTHRTMPSGGWRLDGLIQAVAGELSAHSNRHRRREIRAEAAVFKKAGIVIDGDRVFKNFGSVQQTPGSVQQTPGSVQQTPGLADT